MRRRLNAGAFHVAHRHPEMNNGDMPIHRMLIQIAVEVFLREDFKRLHLESNHNDGYVYDAAGLLRGNKRCYSALLGAKLAGGLFPEYKDLGTFSVNVEKINPQGSSDSATQLGVVNREKIITPVLVDFVLNERPITWENYLNKHGRLLGNAKTPILPLYYTNNFIKCEKSDT